MKAVDKEIAKLEESSRGGRVMRVLIACEESQRVCEAFRARGHEAYSCDVLPCSGGHPEWHIPGDCFAVIDGNCSFTLENKEIRTVQGKWDLIIAHPPCTYLTKCATRAHSARCTPVEAINARTMHRLDAMEFFMQVITADCERIAVENPVGVMSTIYRKPDQIIEPYYFANSSDEYVTKKTCLWLKGLKRLEYDPNKTRPDNASLFGRGPTGKPYCWNDRVRSSVERSKTFYGVANAMAQQWG